MSVSPEKIWKKIHVPEDWTPLLKGLGIMVLLVYFSHEFGDLHIQT